MIYSKKNFAEDLKRKLQGDYSAEELSQWAHLLRIDRYREIDFELNSIIRQIDGMDMGPEFELSEEELWNLVEELESNS
ncbi:hypothetical protein D0962_21090 [Leptolyngbyaceae cyanobacterium CCMR0082]|uniref:Uncharacterized protein n=1 Tax=Adonisia turfae CCMR0082 TaxID=2304604 RepID=A0A6M0S9Z0_9CYAN|nr:hypothetical protein [Adonisia turfae]MDV3347063.1 hypothetical protein [Leptothoe sp. LEGE 181152]NEZ65240.1 hypothetical protein [Adonisia turfae CCMR0082]